MLLTAALIWGLAFAAQSLCTEHIGPFTYGAVRFYIGGTVLLPVIALIKKADSKRAIMKSIPIKSKGNLKMLFIGGICCGVFICTASMLQQAGMETTTAGKAGFITALYVVLVPIFSIFLKRKTPIVVWISVATAVAGLYLLCMNGSFSIATGDIYIFCAAIVFALHILVIDHFSPKVNSVAMSCIQFYTAAVISTVCMFVFERPTVENILACWLPLLYLGVFSTGVAYTLQVVLQKNTNPTVASLLLSFESVFSVLGGWLILGQSLTPRELGGCALMFAAVVLAQLPEELFHNIVKKRG